MKPARGAAAAIALGALLAGGAWEAGAAAGAGAAGKAAPRVRQLIVFRDGGTVAKTVSTKAATVKVGRRRCTAGDGTALAALVRSRPGALALRDFGSCSRRAADGGGLFVRAIRGEANRGQNGWVYKVGRRAASAGAADPGGPFGNGRLKAGQRVTWFYCRMRDGGCQRSLELKLRVDRGELVATVRGYDDAGKGKAVAGAAVTARTSSSGPGHEEGGGLVATTDSAGVARLSLSAGRWSVVAEKSGLVRSFAERVEVP
jgi:hypothetical protein